jgi:hypothetical protein
LLAWSPELAGAVLGEIIAASQGYESKANAEKGIEAIRTHAARARRGRKAEAGRGAANDQRRRILMVGRASNRWRAIIAMRWSIK